MPTSPQKSRGSHAAQQGRLPPGLARRPDPADLDPQIN